MEPLGVWISDWYLGRLRERADVLLRDGRFPVRFDESDLVQNTLAEATRADAGATGCRGTGTGQRLRWLFTIQDRVLVDLYREHTAGKRDIGREQSLNAFHQALADSTASFAGQLADDRPGPGSEAAAREDRTALAAALARLPDDYRRVMELRGDGHTLAGIAAALGKTEGQVTGIVVRAVRRLRDILPNPEGSP